MDRITDITRQDILDIIKEGFVIDFDEPFQDWETGEWISETKVFMPFFGRLDEIKFLDRVYNLRSLPSHDSRYKDAMDDISCHLRFGDYDDGFWFFDDERFSLRDGDGDEPILRFMCEMLHPAVRKEKSQWKQYLQRFNELLRSDGYEIYPAQHISGRDVYGVREYVANGEELFPKNLFTVRYKDLISFGERETKDNISGSVEYSTKKQLCKRMLEFNEPKHLRVSRYDSNIQETDALSVAITRFNEYLDIPYIDLRMAGFSPVPLEELFANYFTPFIFDVIEFQYDELSEKEKAFFQEEINKVLQKDNVSFRLTDRGLIEQLSEYEVLSSRIIKEADSITEPGLRELLSLAFEKHMLPDSQSHKDAVEKIWDVLERLKTYYSNLDKRSSAERIISDMSGGVDGFAKLFDDEFKTLTRIGNEFRIRHHETDKIDIADIRHYDYFFNRCLSLITLAMQYLK